MNSASAAKYLICASCGPDAKKCLRQNALCNNPRVAVDRKAYEKVTRAWVFAKRPQKMIERNFMYNYYDYYVHDYDDEYLQ